MNLDNQINSLLIIIGEQIRLRRKELMITQPGLATMKNIMLSSVELNDHAPLPYAPFLLSEGLSKCVVSYIKQGRLSG